MRIVCWVYLRLKRFYVQLVHVNLEFLKQIQTSCTSWTCRSRNVASVYATTSGYIFICRTTRFSSLLIGCKERDCRISLSCSQSTGLKDLVVRQMKMYPRLLREKCYTVVVKSRSDFGARQLSATVLLKDSAKGRN